MENEENDLQDLEELTEEEQVTQPDSISIEEPQAAYTSLVDVIQQTINAPLFYFTISEISAPKGLGATRYVAGQQSIVQQKFFSLGDVMTGSVYVKHIPQELKTRFRDVVENPTQEKLVSLVNDVNNHLQDNKATQSVPVGEGRKATSILVEFDKKKSKEGNFSLSTGEGAAVNAADFANVVEKLDFEKIDAVDKEAAEQAEAASAVTGAQIAMQDVQGGPVRTSAPAWGFKTDNEGMIVNSKGERVKAPFFKGEEYSMFEFDLEEDDIFRLQQQMVQAGMDAPPVTEFGQWTAREANFMSIIFSNATDSGKWETDSANGLQGWESTLAEVAEDNQEIEAFVKLMADGKYGQNPGNATPAQIQNMLDSAAASLGIVLSAKDYADYANVVTKALTKASVLEAEYNKSTVTDKDLILGAKFRDARSIGKGEYGRFLKGSMLPLVIPSYEALSGQKGVKPEVMSAQEIVTEELQILKAPQIAGQDYINNLKYTTNLFESAMNQIEFVGEA